MVGMRQHYNYYLDFAENHKMKITMNHIICIFCMIAYKQSFAEPIGCYMAFSNPGHCVEKIQCYESEEYNLEVHGSAVGEWCSYSASITTEARTLYDFYLKADRAATDYHISEQLCVKKLNRLRVRYRNYVKRNKGD